MKTFVLNGVTICFVSADELLVVIKQHPGITVWGLHKLGYRLVMTPLLELLTRHEVFGDSSPLMHARFYPNN